MSTEAESMRRELEALPTEELVSILRNRDDEEWRPEVFAVVASILTSRGLSPGDVSALGPEGIDVAEGQPLATVGRYFNPVEAHAHRLALEDGGIRAWISDESLGTIYGVGIGARLQVRAEDEAAAREILNVGPVPASALPPELAEAPCPRCGSREVSQRADVVVAPLLIPHWPSRAWRYECGSCGHSWSD